MKKNLNVLIISLLVLISVIFSGTICFADDEIDYVKGRPLTEEEIAEQKALEPELQTLPKITDSITVIDGGSSLKRARGILPAGYDMREQAYSSVIKVKDQKETGLCWAFSTTTVSEIYRAKALSEAGKKVTAAEFSPLHLGYFLYNRVNDPLGNTGSDKNETYYNYMMAGCDSHVVFQALAGWTGLASEETMPFKSRSSSSFSSKLAYKNEYILDSAEYITDGNNAVTLDSVKQAIMENGSVVADMYYNDVFMNYNTSAYNNTLRGAAYSNHMIAIIGWDDSYSKNNFKEVPENDGAWIVQNSYSSEWGDDGYMYMSYEDLALSCPMILRVEPAYSYDYNYQYDGNANPEYLELDAGMKMANVFKVPSTSGAQSLEAIGFTSWNMGETSYNVEIRTNVTSASNPAAGTKASSFAVTTDNEGYFTFDLPESIELKPGSKYSIIITVNEDTGFGVEGSYDYGWLDFSAGHIKGTSFIYDPAGKEWEDLYYEGLSARIKGLASEAKPIDISKAAASISYSNYSYKGSAIAPVPTVKYNGRILDEGIDYTLEYGENIYPGKGYIYIKGIGDFKGTLTKSFYIARVYSVGVKSYGTNAITLKWKSFNDVDGYKIYMYKSGEYKCIKTVEGASAASATIKNLASGNGYSFKVSTYVNGHEGYLSDKLSAPVKPNTGKIKKITTSSSHYVKAYWYKRTGSGYQVKRASNSKFTSNVGTCKITSSGTLSKKMTGLKKGRTYYVKVRAYKTYGGKTVYGSWSSYKKIRCK